ncbi:hypothetical protein TNCV_54021 [Trichonephila clavipes]|nr:hypothetical protein TNCV_54021 [Trichonephila clavipes]
MGPFFKGLSVIFLKSALKGSSSSDARPMTQSESEALASVSMASEVLEVLRLRDLFETELNHWGILFLTVFKERRIPCDFQRISLAGLAQIQQPVEDSESPPLCNAGLIQAAPGATRQAWDYTPADRAARTCWLGCPGLLYYLAV